MEVYNQFVLPTASKLAVCCNFTKSDDLNIIVSKGNLLQVFKLLDINTRNKVTDAEIVDLSGYTIDNGTQYKLTMVSEYHLFGKIISIHKFRPENEKVDYLMVSTETAKISVVKWNPSDNLVSVISLHYYESVFQSLLFEDIQAGEVLHRSDPNNGCTIMFINDLIVVLPFKNEDLLSDINDNDDYQPVVDLVHTKSVDTESNSTDLFLGSFVMNAKTLHDDLKNIVDIQFLYSYKNPTLAILYSPEDPISTSTLVEKKDNLKVIVLSLDLNVKSADILMEINNLPYDLERVFPLSDPLNGFLLTGANEVIHINSMGAAKGIYVNEYYPLTSGFDIKNQGDLDLFLELAEFCQLTDNEVLMITQDGCFYTLVFDNVGGVSHLNKIIKNEVSGFQGLNISLVLNIVKIPERNLLFVCSDGSDAMLLQWDYQSTGSEKDSTNPTYEDEEDMWLYDNSDSNNEDKLSTSISTCKFTVVDKLINIGLLSDFTLAPHSLEPKFHGLSNPNYNETAIFSASGCDSSGAMAVIAPTVKPIIKSTLKFSNASKIWTVEGHKQDTKYLIITDQKSSTTQIFEVHKDYMELKPKDFRGRSFTVQFGSFKTNEKIRLVQVLAHKIIVYNLSFTFITTLSFDQEINNAVIYDNFIVLLMSSGEIDVLEYNDSPRKLVKMDLPALLNYLIFTNAWVTKSSLLKHSISTKKRDFNGDIIDRNVSLDEDEYLFWLVTADNRLLVFKQNHLEKVFEFKNIHKMPEYLQLSPMDPQYEADVDPMMKQCIFTDIGDGVECKDYLIILTFGGEIIMYETFFDPSQQCFRFIKANDLFALPISGAPGNSYLYATKIERNLFKMDNLCGSKAVMVSGTMSFMIYKQHNSVPRMFKFTSHPFLYFSSFTTHNCINGLITIDDKKSCRMVQLDFDYDYSNTYPIRKIPVGKTLSHIAYHDESQTFAVSSIRKEPFKLHDKEDEEEIIKFNADLRMPAKNYRSSVHLISSSNWQLIDTYDLNENETCTTLKVLTLRMNGTDSERVTIFVGTGVLQTEEIASSGSWKLFDVAEVVAESGNPEQKYKLKYTSGETAKGPVLDACELDGRFAVIQGQRLLVRMIKSEGQVVPVAFTDTSLYSAKVKSFENLVVTGDSFHSMSLYGFDADPYRMIPLGQDEHALKLNDCEFIIHNQNLFVVAADDNSNLHVLQYDPYDPKSLKGHKLLRKTVFRSNSQTTKMIRLNRRSSLFSMVTTLPIRKDVDIGFEILGSNIDGSFYKMSPINEYQYRRLYSLQNFIADKEHHWLGLNPKMNSMGNLQGEMPIIKRPVIEFKLLTKFNSMSEEKKRMFAMRLGKDALVDVYRDLISLQ